MYYVGSCPVCGDGLRGIRSCCGRLVVLCDECDALWSTPELTDRVLSSSDPACGECEQSLWGETAHWASRAEIESRGWWSNVDGEVGERSSFGEPRLSDDVSLLNRPAAQGSTDASESTRAVPGRGHLLMIFTLMLIGGTLAVLALI